MTYAINETRLRKACQAAYGETMGEIAFGLELEKAKKSLAAYEALKAARDAATVELKALEATLPRLEPLRAAMDDAYTLWLNACNALENQRSANVGAASAISTRLQELNTQIVLFNSPIRIEPWTKSTLFQEPERPVPLAEESIRKKIAAEREANS
jgi:hypothetical protein